MPQFPTLEDQLFIELINRTRADPTAEAGELVDAATQTGVSPGITLALQDFGVDLDLFAAQMAAYPSVAPLAWNEHLAQSALTHSQLMLDYDEQSHFLPGEPGLQARVELAGYENPSAIGENVYGYGADVVTTHGSFVIDWGDTPTGMQIPAGHRDTILNPSYTEIGSGILYDTDPATHLGELVVSHHLATSFDYVAQVLGVAIMDDNLDGFYGIGEGLEGVTVTASGATGTFSTTTWASGGYQMALPAGSYTLTFSNAAFPAPYTQTFTIGDDNVKVDAILQNVELVGIAQRGSTEGDDLQGGLGGDTLAGGAGADTVLGGSGDDSLLGGIGWDDIDGGNDDDTVFGNDGYDTLQGGLGDDSLIGNNGFDHIDGGDGSDTAAGGLGLDTLNGAGGDDLLNGQQGGDDLNGGDGNDTLNGNSGADLLNGDAGDDLLTGGINHDTLYGGDGDDSLNGSNGSDVLYGEAGADRLEGNAGADRLDGGAGNDILRGGIGQDTFVFAEGFDVILDFSNNFDRIEIDASLMTEAAPVVADLANYALVFEGSLYFEFGASQLQLHGVTNLASVLDDVVLF